MNMPCALKHVYCLFLCIVLQMSVRSRRWVVFPLMFLYYFFCPVPLVAETQVLTFPAMLADFSVSSSGSVNSCP